MVTRVIIASHRGFCAGVERAVETVERALEIYGPPVYVRKQIVHNTHVVRDLEARGAIFVESTSDVPREGRLILAAHGVALEVYREAGDREVATIDATCPLVTKVHVQVRRFADAGYCVILVGHAGHDEVVGTAGQAPGGSGAGRDARAGACRRGTRSGARGVRDPDDSSPSTKPRRSLASSASDSRRSSARGRKTSVTRPRIANSP